MNGASTHPLHVIVRGEGGDIPCPQRHNAATPGKHLGTFF